MVVKTGEGSGGDMLLASGGYETRNAAGYTSYSVQDSPLKEESFGPKWQLCSS